MTARLSRNCDKESPIHAPYHPEENSIKMDFDEKACEDED
jgi:hypothetical protein